MDLIFHRLVQHDLRLVLRYYESEGGDLLADRFFAELQALVVQVSQRPASFHPDKADLRRANLKNFPYHLLFRLRANSIHVLVLRHHRRHPDYGTKRTQ
jgi:plasmid stabilization system protein ParE